jgi:hypothetical protein
LGALDASSHPTFMLPGHRLTLGIAPPVVRMLDLDRAAIVRSVRLESTRPMGTCSLTTLDRARSALDAVVSVHGVVHEPAGEASNDVRWQHAVSQTSRLADRSTAVHSGPLVPQTAQGYGGRCPGVAVSGSLQRFRVSPRLPEPSRFGAFGHGLGTRTSRRGARS